MSTSQNNSDALERAAIVVGINQYEPGIPPLVNARRDAVAIAECLADVHGYTVTALLLDRDAGAAEILSAIATLSLRISRQARVVFYFAGHGVAREREDGSLAGFVLAAEAVARRENSYLAMHELRAALLGIECRHLLVILDCCFASSFALTVRREFESLEREPLPRPVYERWMARDCRQLLASAAPAERALDYLSARARVDHVDGLDQDHSPFASALLAALRRPVADANSDGVVTARDLERYIDERLNAPDSPVNGAQSPILWPLEGHAGAQFFFELETPKLAEPTPLTPADNPYRGLEPYREDDTKLFFGRAALVAELRARVATHPLTILTGLSGVGKTSLIRAGLVPELKRDSSHGLRWSVEVVRPGTQPTRRLADTLEALLQAPGDLRLLVVDQLEEVVTIAETDDAAALSVALVKTLHELHELQEPAVQQAPTPVAADTSIKRIIDAARGLGSRLRVLLILRSDFEPHFRRPLHGLTDRRLIEYWTDSRVLARPMNRDERRACIEGPAARKVVFFAEPADGDGVERGLVDTLLDETDTMPAAMPLLSLALSSMYASLVERAGGDLEERTIRHRDYLNAGGGVLGALEAAAESIYTRDTSPGEQQALLRVLLRMTDEAGSEPARRVARGEELTPADGDELARVKRALDRLTAARLVVPLAPDSSDGAREPAGVPQDYEPVHDALLKGWPRLAAYLTKHRLELRLLREVANAASRWRAGGRSSELLWIDARADGLLRLESLHELLDTQRAHHQLERGRVRSFWRRLWSTTYVLEVAPPHTFSSIERQFLIASLARRRALRLSLAALAVTIIAILSVISIGLVNALARESVALEGTRDALARESVALEGARAATKQAEAAGQRARDAVRVNVARRLSARSETGEIIGQDPTTGLLLLAEVQPANRDAQWYRAAMSALRTPHAQQRLEFAAGRVYARPSTNESIVVTSAEVQVWPHGASRARLRIERGGSDLQLSGASDRWGLLYDAYERPALLDLDTGAARELPKGTVRAAWIGETAEFLMLEEERGLSVRDTALALRETVALTEDYWVSGQIAAAATGRRVVLWQSRERVAYSVALDRDERCAIDVQEDINELAIAHDGSEVWALDTKGRLHVVTTSTCEPVAVAGLDPAEPSSRARAFRMIHADRATRRAVLQADSWIDDEAAVGGLDYFLLDRREDAEQPLVDLELAAQPNQLVAFERGPLRRVAVTDDEKDVRIFDPAGRLVSELRGLESPPRTIDFSPGGCVVTSSDGDARVWTPDNQTWPIVFKSGYAEVSAFAYSSSSAELAMGGRPANATTGGGVQLLGGMDTLEPTVRGARMFEGTITELYFDDRGRVVTLDAGDKLRAWSGDALERMCTFASRVSSQQGVKVTPDGRYAAFVLDEHEQIRVMPLAGMCSADAEVLFERAADPGFDFGALALSADARRVAAVLADYDEQGALRTRVHVWDASRGDASEAGVIEVEGYARDLTFLGGSHRLLVRTENNRLSVWDTREASAPTRERVLDTAGHAKDNTTGPLGVSPDGSLIALVDTNANLRVQRSDGSGTPRSLRAGSGDSSGVQLVFSVDNRRLLVVGHEDAWIWSLDEDSPSAVPLISGDIDIEGLRGALRVDGDQVALMGRVGRLFGQMRVFETPTRAALSDWLRAATDVCIPAGRRIDLLGESSVVAYLAYLECLARRPRTPPAIRCREGSAHE